MVKKAQNESSLTSRTNDRHVNFYPPYAKYSDELKQPPLIAFIIKNKKVALIKF